ncbi:MAG: hypothetical protein P4L67_04970 [Candidatus Pacebacteria bacterium]|nr:hypothetical protein [Candidatus Paceibacterota bacterium]
MSTIETKRRGRPPKPRDAEDAIIEAVEADVPDDEVQVVIKHDGPPCPRCTRSTQRSTRLLRRYDLAALRCDFCRQVAIEGDGPHQWWDTLTATTGNPPPLVVRAMAIYGAKHNIQPPPPAQHDGTYEAMTSDWDDERWTEVGA